MNRPVAPAPKARRPRYDEGGPACAWCGNPAGKDNPGRTWFDPESLPGVMTPVCGPVCEDRPAGAAFFDYEPVRVGQMGGRG